MPLEGKQLGRYHILRVIGTGGMGTVYLAEDTRVRRQVAAKIIQIEVAQASDEGAANALRLFLREATAIARLDHPHILPLYDYGEETLDGDHFAYLITPYRAEGSLVTWLRKGAAGQKSRQITLKQVEHVVQQAAGALQYAHNQQVIHQDIKPSNFLIRSRPDEDEYPDLMLADFGIARLATTTSSMSQNVRGTPTYMAPEQWAGEPVFASDQYALAVMTYELLTGRPTFQGTPMNMMYLHLQQPPQPPRELNPLLPPALDGVLLRALAKKPAERFPSVSEFARTFQAAFKDFDEGTTIRALPSAYSTPQTPGAQSASDIRATLAISADEARSGTARVLTLPGGRKVNVQVPSGAQDGQVLILATQDDGTLYLTLSVLALQTQVPTLANETAIPYAGDALPTILSSSRQAFPADTGPTQEATGPALVAPKEPAPTPIRTERITPPSRSKTDPALRHVGELTMPPVPGQARRRNSPLKAFLLVLLVVVFIGGGAGAYYWYTTNNKPPTTTGSSNSGTGNGSQLSSSDMTATARATTMKNAATTTQNPYPPGGGALVINDDLTTDSGIWHTGTTPDGSCQFTGDAYHIVAGTATFGHEAQCLTVKSDNLANFAFQAQMTILQGDGGGFLFRANPNKQFFVFYITASGNWALEIPSIDAPYLQNIATGIVSGLALHRPILLAVVARGSQIELYVNLQQIGTINSSVSDTGSLGFVAKTVTATQSEVAFNYARLWVF